MTGFWTATFRTPVGFGYGVAYFADGQVFGGDSAFTYIGDYQAQGTQISARLRVTPYNNSMTSVFGNGGPFDLTVNGTVQGNAVNGRGSASHFPGVPFEVSLTKVQ